MKLNSEEVRSMVPPDPVPLTRIRFVLVETTHPGNIGAVARAMKTMGLGRIDLVKPRHFPNAEALAMASGADDLLQRAGVHQDLTAALAGCRLAVGSSARLRTIEWPLLTPAQCAERLVAEAAHGEVALVLGRESSGLSNEELARCQYLVNIPTDPGFSSLNLAAAAQVFAYEIRRTWLAGLPDQAPPEAGHEPAPAEDLEGFYGHLMQALEELGFRDQAQSHKLERRLRRLFHRARPDRTELNILRGILSAAQGRKTPGRFRKDEAANERK
jgi:tRNA (cytidine32/uridine32-2'-O)-methyltransferase